MGQVERRILRSYAYHKSVVFLSIHKDKSNKSSNNIEHRDSIIDSFDFCAKTIEKKKTTTTQENY
jgi:hypothetical protein